MEYHGKIGHNLGQIQHICPMSIIYSYYTYLSLATKTVVPTLPGFQGSKCCIQYMVSHPDKLIFYPSNSYYVSNFIILTWSGNQF